MRSARVLIVALGLLLCAGIPARAELSQQGGLIVGFDGGLMPRALPRSHPVPVAVRVAGKVRDAGGEQARLPQLRTITVAINRAGRIFDRGLPSCEVSSIQPATEREARRVCGGAIIGSGRVVVQARIASQEPVLVRGKLLAFNGPREGGRKLIFAQVYAKDPPGAFVLAFEVKRGRGLFGTVMSTTLPPVAQGWAYLTDFEMTLKRTYSYRGRTRSYISAACAAPAGFPGATFPFARSTYGFEDGRKLRTTVVRSCRVKGGA
ncbi:MAG TPA: hypothetical protein VEW07_08325 [Solirubrobacterales bacterium]|nr:hypothetical protein [Solirubrobacterales bacterium]